MNNKNDDLENFNWETNQAVILQFPTRYKPSKKRQFRMNANDRQRLLRRHGLDGYGGVRLLDCELRDLEIVALVAKRTASNKLIYQQLKSSLTTRTSQPLASNITLLEIERYKKQKRNRN